MTAIIAAIISGGLALVGVVLTINSSNHKIQASFEKSQAVMAEQIKELTREVRAHNGFAQKMPVLEEKLNNIDARLKKVEDGAK